MAAQRRFGARVATLTLASALLFGVTGALVIEPATAAVPTPDIDVRIARLTPAILIRPTEVTVYGSLRNSDNRAWKDAEVYIVRSTTPFLGHSQARTAIAGGAGSPTDRILAPTAIGSLGDLQPGETNQFSVTATAAQLGLSGRDGVYPIGVQILASTADASAQRVVIGRATTFLPIRARRTISAPTVVLWPFLLPGTRTSDGSYADTAELAKSIGPRGQMRNLLDLALTTPRRGSDILLDPSLLAVVEDLSRAPGRSKAAAARRKAAADFLADLTRAADRYSCTAVGFDQPDLIALARTSSAPELNPLIEQATTGTLDEFGIECARLEWLTRRGVSAGVLSALRRSGTPTVIVSKGAVTGWESAAGNLVERSTSAGVVTLLVDDPLDAGLPGLHGALTLRQAILSEAVFSSMAAQATGERRPAITVVDPKLNPGPVAGAPLKAAVESDLVSRANLAATIRGTHVPYVGPLPGRTLDKPISATQVASAADAAQTAQLLNTLVLGTSAQTAHAQDIARLVSRRWRAQRTAGAEAAQQVSARLSKELAAISVEGPEALTLSGRSGQFPVTVRNKTPYRVRVGLTIDSSPASVTFKAPMTVTVAAGESRTTTANINLDGQSAATVTVRLTAAQGQSFGASTVFNVRSSRVGAALWLAIGISVGFVVFALVRRFARPGHQPVSPTLSPDDFDD